MLTVLDFDDFDDLLAIFDDETIDTIDMLSRARVDGSAPNCSCSSCRSRRRCPLTTRTGSIEDTSKESTMAKAWMSFMVRRAANFVSPAFCVRRELILFVTLLHISITVAVSMSSHLIERWLAEGICTAQYRGRLAK